MSRIDKRPDSNKSPSPEIRHLNQKQLGQRLGVSQRTLEGWRYRRKGPAYLRLEGRIAYRVAAMSLPPELNDTQREAVRAAIAESFIIGYRAVMAIAAGLALASAGVAWLMIRPTSHGGS